MSKPATLESVSVSVDSLSITIGSLSTTVDSLSTKVDSIAQSIGNLVTREEFKKEISKLPTRDEMNTAISDSFDELARMVAVGFKETNGMIYSLEKRFDGLESRFDGMENRFDGLEETLVTNHGHRLRRIESKLQLA
jgi:hypothetical protein